MHVHDRRIKEATDLKYTQIQCQYYCHHDCQVNIIFVNCKQVNVYSIYSVYMFNTTSIRERKERRDSLKKGESSSMLLCTCISCTRMHTIVYIYIYIQAAATA